MKNHFRSLLPQPSRVLEEFAPEQAAPWGHREDMEEARRRRALAFLARKRKAGSR